MPNEQITLQIGHYSNFIASHYWNFLEEHNCRQEDCDNDFPEYFDHESLYRQYKKNGKDLYAPRALVFDLRGNLGTLNPYSENQSTLPLQDFNWDNQRETFENKRDQKNSFLKSLESLNNYDYSSESFDQYGQRLSENEVSEMELEAEEDGFENTSPSAQDIVDITLKERYFLEECDNIANVTVLLDLESGFAGVGCDLLQTIREELPRVAMPVWASGNPRLSTAPPTPSIDALSLPLVYNHLLPELASVVIPLHPYAAHTVSTSLSISAPTPTPSPYITSSILASAFECIVGTSHISSQSSNSDSSSSSSSTAIQSRDVYWLGNATRNGQFPLCQLEVCLPSPLSSTQFICQLWENSPTSSSPSRTNQSSIPLLNHFATSLSLTSMKGYYPSSPPIPAATATATAGMKRAYSNLVSVRGSAPYDLSSQLFERCINSNYSVSGVNQRVSPLALPPSFPKVLSSEPLLLPATSGAASRRATSSGTSGGNEASRTLTAFAAVGCGETTGSHISHIAKRWNDSLQSRVCFTQLTSAGLSSDDCHEVHETLLAQAERYQ